MYSLGQLSQALENNTFENEIGTNSNKMSRYNET